MLDSRRLWRRRTKIAKPLFRGKYIKEDLAHYTAEAASIRKELKIRGAAKDFERAKELRNELAYVNHLVASFSRRLKSVPKKRKRGVRGAVRVLWAGNTARKKLLGLKKIREKKASD